MERKRTPPKKKERGGKAAHLPKRRRMRDPPYHPTQLNLTKVQQSKHFLFENVSEIQLSLKFISFHFSKKKKIKERPGPTKGGRGKQHHQKEEENAARDVMHHRRKGGGEKFSFFLVWCCLPSPPFDGAAFPVSCLRVGLLSLSPLAGGAFFPPPLLWVGLFCSPVGWWCLLLGGGDVSPSHHWIFPCVLMFCQLLLNHSLI